MPYLPTSESVTIRPPFRAVAVKPGLDAGPVSAPSATILVSASARSPRIRV